MRVLMISREQLDAATLLTLELATVVARVDPPNIVAQIAIARLLGSSVAFVTGPIEPAQLLGGMFELAREELGKAMASDMRAEIDRQAGLDGSAAGHA